MSKIHAIKFMREASGLGLHEAKRLVEGVERELAVDTPAMLAGDKTLRDEFAMAALTGLIAARAVWTDSSFDRAASRAYQFADAMLEARSK